MLKLGQSLEDYLEAIYILKKSHSCVYSIDVAKYLGFSKPSVSRAVKLLKQEEYLVVQGDGTLILTQKGIEVAQKMYERHRFFSEILIKLGIDKETARQDACRIEHAISQESFEKLRQVLQQTVN